MLRDTGRSRLSQESTKQQNYLRQKPLILTCVSSIGTIRCNQDKTPPRDMLATEMLRVHLLNQRPHNIGGADVLETNYRRGHWIDRHTPTDEDWILLRV